MSIRDNPWLDSNGPQILLHRMLCTILCWIGYSRKRPIKSFFRELDKWVRRRIRSCCWKQWKNPRTRIANLKRLGVRAKEAITHGACSKGPWVMSSSEAVHQALSNDYLSESGLPSLLEIWRSACCQETNRLVRTRMLGGAGGTPGNRAPIPMHC